MGNDPRKSWLGDSVAIKVSAIDHSVLVGSSLTIVKDKPVIVNVHSTVSISVDAITQTSTLKDESSWDLH